MAQNVQTAETLNSLFTGLNLTFNNITATANKSYEATTMVIPSNSKVVDYSWLTTVPKMREWLGERVIHSLDIKSYYIANKTYESTITVNKDDIDDDIYGIYSVQAAHQAFIASNKFNELVDGLKNGGFTNLGMDGLTFYNTNHIQISKNGVDYSYSNRGSAPLSAATLASANASLGAARVAMSKYTDAEGNFLGITPSILEVPPALESQAKIMITSPTLLDLSPNPFMGSMQVIVNPALTSDTAWFAHAVYGQYKPFILQIREQPTFTRITDESSDSVFFRNAFLFGVKSRAGSGYGLSQLSYGSTGV
jgi:phage major head subunit gpT-like protein